MTADDYRNAPLPANRAPELRIAWRCDAEGYVTTVYLLGAAKAHEPSFIDVVRKYRGGSVLEPHDIVWPKGYAAHYGVHQMDRAMPRETCSAPAPIAQRDQSDCASGERAQSTPAGPPYDLPTKEAA